MAARPGRPTPSATSRKIRAKRRGIYAPYQPRFDWNLWFASLDNWQQNRFVVFTEERLLTGSPSVLALFAGNPFAAAPPREVRAVVYQYWFTDWSEKQQGLWWRRRIWVFTRPKSSASQMENSRSPRCPKGARSSASSLAARTLEAVVGTNHHCQENHRARALPDCPTLVPPECSRSPAVPLHVLLILNDLDEIYLSGLYLRSRTIGVGV